MLCFGKKEREAVFGRTSSRSHWEIFGKEAFTEVILLAIEMFDDLFAWFEIW